MGYMRFMQTVAETPIFTKQADDLFDEDEKQELITFLSLNPLAGDVIAGAGGVRKVRFAASGRGKRGGARVVYFYHNPSLPLFALTAYAKNQRDDLTQDQRDGFRQLAKSIAETYGVKGKRKSQ